MLPHEYATMTEEEACNRIRAAKVALGQCIQRLRHQFFRQPGSDRFAHEFLAEIDNTRFPLLNQKRNSRSSFGIIDGNIRLCRKRPWH